MLLLRCFAFLVGVVLLLHAHNIYVLFVCLSLATLLVFCVYSRCRYLPLFCFFGALYAAFFVYYIHLHSINKSLEKKPLLVRGEIVSLVKNAGRLKSFFFQINETHGERFNGKVKLAYYGYKLQLKAGSHWQFLVKLKRPWGFANPGGFLYQHYLLMQGVLAKGYVVEGAENHRLRGSRLSMLTWRSWLKAKIAVQGNQYKRFIQALSIGYRGNFSNADWLVLQRTGTNHLVAISGLHVGLIAGLCFFLVGLLWRSSRLLCLWQPASVAAAISAILIAFLYSALSGFALPTQRAFAMLAIFMLGYVFRRSFIAWQSWCLALWVVLLLNPLSVLDGGFWLSFSAVAALIAASGVTKKGRLLEYLKPQFLVLLGVTPFTLFYFHQFSFVSPLANILTIPVVGFFVVPLCLLMVLFDSLHVFFLARVCLLLAEHCMAVVWFLLTELSHLSFAAVNVGYFPFWKCVLLLFVLFIFLSVYRWRCQLLASVLLPLLFVSPGKVRLGDFKFTLLDVGQGLASVVQTRHHVLIYDAGPKFSKTFNAGEAVVVPYLQSQGVNTVNLMVISHGDRDHIGGAFSILKTMRVLAVKSSVPKRFRHASLCLRGEHWRWDGVNFRFLFPDKRHLGLDNNSSCVLRVSNGRQSLLLTGDIEKPVERYLLRQEKHLLKTNVLVAPHHGSKTSSTLAFVKAVKPRYVLYPVGYLNRFHFPNKSVVERYKKLGIRQLGTDSCGAIYFVTDGLNPVVPICYRHTLAFIG